MATIQLIDVWHSYDLEEGKTKDPQYAVEDVNVTYENGSAVALLGPSGCGKTTLLKIISGLTKPSKGRVLFDGKDVTELSAKERHIAQVFQFPVVYDSMNVYGNIAFPLANDGVDSDTIRKRVYEVAEILEITSLLKVPAGKLNPADKQKVSLGRGIVRPDTAAVLLDEPLTVIDPKAQWGLRRKLKQVQEELDFTMIYVTHDQHEALTFADNVTIIKDGRLVQQGTPQELHSRPETPFIGYFIGSPGMNLLDCQLKDDTLAFEDFELTISRTLKDTLKPYGTSFQTGIRPESIVSSNSGGNGAVDFQVAVVEDTGAYRIATCEKQASRIKARVPASIPVNEGEPLWLSFPEDKMNIFYNEKRIV